MAQIESVQQCSSPAALLVAESGAAAVAASIAVDLFQAVAEGRTVTRKVGLLFHAEFLAVASDQARSAVEVLDQAAPELEFV